MVETLYLPSGKDIHTEIPVKLMAGIDYRAYIEVAPDHQKFFETIQGSVPTFDGNKLLLPVSCLRANGENSSLSFSFNLLADLADNKTAEGQTIPVTLKLVRLVNGEDADTKATIPFTIACNSPLPAIIDNQLVREASTGALIALFNFDATPEEMKLRHRDIVTLKYTKSGGLIGANPPVTYPCNIDENGLLTVRVNEAINPFSLAKASTAYEVLNNGSEPKTTIIQGTTVAISSLGTAGEVSLDITISDSIGFQTSTTISDSIKTIMYPIVTDTIKAQDATLVSQDTENLLAFDTTNKGKIKIQLPNQAYNDGRMDPPNLTNAETVSGVVVKYSFGKIGGTMTENQATTDKEITLDQEATYQLTLWAEKSGYATSIEKTYTITLQRNIYATPSGTGNKGFLGDELNLEAAIERATTIREQSPNIILDGEFTATSDKLTLTLGPYNDGQKPDDHTLTLISKNKNSKAKIKSPIISETYNLVIDSVDISTSDSSNAALSLTNNKAKNTTISGTTTISSQKYRGVQISANQGVFTMKDNTIIQACGDVGILASNGTTINLNDDAKITGCNGYKDGNNIRNGGGIYGTSATLNVKGNAIISGNTADKGGGIYSFGSMVTISDDARIEANIATKGGGIYMYGDSAKVTIEGNAQILDNTANGSRSDNTGTSGRGCGGGIFIEQGTLTVGGSSIINGNKALEVTSLSGGGGIYIGGGTVNIIGNACIGNPNATTEATAVSGVDQSSKVSGNHAYATGSSISYGGGICNYGGTLCIGSSINDQNKYISLGRPKIYGNYAQSGGGIYTISSTENGFIYVTGGVNYNSTERGAINIDCRSSGMQLKYAEIGNLGTKNYQHGINQKIYLMYMSFAAAPNDRIGFVDTSGLGTNVSMDQAEICLDESSAKSGLTLIKGSYYTSFKVYAITSDGTHVDITNRLNNGVLQ